MNNRHRQHLPDRIVQMSPRPICSYCHRYMGIIKTNKCQLIGVKGNYLVIINYYQCRHKGCPGCKSAYFRLPNPYAGALMSYDYEVQAEVCKIRWTEHATYIEIVDRIKDRFQINLDKTAVELFLKTYEIGCTNEYRESYLQTIRDHGGIMLCVDVMEPLQGQDGFLVAYDAWSHLTFGSYRIPNNKQTTYEKYLSLIKNRIANEIGVPILGIISDALPAQRLAIETVFEGIPHCLCHYHFFNLVLKSIKQLDSQIITQFREDLRAMYDLKQFQLRIHEHTLDTSQYAKLVKFFEPLVELSNWRRKPNDPCLISLNLYSRINDITTRLKVLQTKIEVGKIRFPSNGIKVINRVILILTNLLTEVNSEIKILQTVRTYLESLVVIFDEFEASAEDGLEQLHQFCDTLRPRLNLLSKTDKEAIFIEALLKFVDTKGDLLFNYRNILNAPTTNNDLELRFKQMKHLLRRTIGHSAAKHYLMMHGERIFYVNPNEKFEQIVSILKNMDQSDARIQIRMERLSNDRLGLVIHDDVRWTVLLSELDQYLTKLECS